LGKGLHPIAFHSRKLNDAKGYYEIHDKDPLAILEAFREWKHYLFGADDPAPGYSDHQYLKDFITTKVWNPRQMQWDQLLANLNFKIVYCPGSREEKPDALSRRPEYRLEEGAAHREQTILKPECFEI